MAKETEFDWSKAHPWMRAAYDFGNLNQTFHAINRGSEEHKSWAKYFEGLGWVPQTFLMFEAGQIQKWTAPCQWPEWLTIDATKVLEKPRPRGRFAGADA